MSAISAPLPASVRGTRKYPVAIFGVVVWAVSGTMSSERSDDDHHIYHRTVEATSEGANSDIVELVADIEECEIDDLVADVFSDPPAPGAQVRLKFTYAGYGYRSTRATEWS